MRKICLYHRSDLDGKCSGAIVKRHIPGTEMIGIDYGDKIPWKDLEGAHVYLVDFSLQPWTDMIRLADVAEKHK